MTVSQAAIDAAAEAMWGCEATYSERASAALGLEVAAPILRAESDEAMFLALQMQRDLLREEWRAGHASADDLYDEVKAAQCRREIDTLRAQLAEAGATIDRAMREVEDHISEMVDAQQERDELKAQLAEAERVIENVRDECRRATAGQKAFPIDAFFARVGPFARDILALLTPIDKDGGK